MKFKLQRADLEDRELIESMDAQCFPEDDPVAVKFNESTEWWILLAQGPSGEWGYAGYCGMKILGTEACYLHRAGVLAPFRGNGLQKRLIRTRLARAKQLELPAITYTVLNNHASSNSLIKAGFKLYDPAYAWAGRKETLYWIKE